MCVFVVINLKNKELSVVSRKIKACNLEVECIERFLLKSLKIVIGNYLP